MVVCILAKDIEAQEVVLKIPSYASVSGITIRVNHAGIAIASDRVTAAHRPRPAKRRPRRAGEQVRGQWPKGIWAIVRDECRGRPETGKDAAVQRFSARGSPLQFRQATQRKRTNQPGTAAFQSIRLPLQPPQRLQRKAELHLRHGLAGVAVVLDHKRLGHDERPSNGCVQCGPACSITTAQLRPRRCSCSRTVEALRGEPFAVTVPAAARASLMRRRL